MLTVTFDAHDPALVGRFWGGLLGRDVVAETGGVLLPGTGGQLSLRFSAAATRKTGLNVLHLHVTSDGADDQQQTVAKALKLGASHLDVGQLPEEDHVVLADPEGNEFCVIEPGNNFLAGCGTLGEIACDGPRAVGAFWGAALGWPLVWDQDDETAIQSPQGGTKVAWGGGTPLPEPTRHRQHFDLTVEGDRQAEIDRLIAVGATRHGADADGTVLFADPGGNVFAVRHPTARV